ncbi:hypothetical protein [Pseudoruminococcus massiliensis]|uniref:hypothetical protein n=1 Tax=Pseudoruminococcus massiliensis TaxID=2086583 RepID=UPI003AB73DA5
MQVSQIYELINTTTKEVLGDSVVVAEDLSNVVDVGTAIFNANSFDNYVRKLVDRIGKVVFVNRPYTGLAPSVYMDSVMWGSVTQKISSAIPEAVENESYELVNGASYDPNQVNLPDVYVKFFSKYATFEVDRTITEKQLRSAFTGVAELDGFVSMIFNEISKAFTIAIDNLIMRTINSAIADTLYKDYGSDTVFTGASHTRAVNLLYLYNQRYSTSITATEAVTTPEFVRFASYYMGLYSDRLSRMSTLFNVGETQKFTPKEEQHFILLSEFARSADVFLQSDVYHNEFTAITKYEVVPYWQGSGTDYAFNSTSAINVTSGSGNTVTASGILGVMFDRYALGVTNVEQWVNTQYNAKADFTNYFYKYKAGYFNDLNENFVVFFVA